MRQKTLLNKRSVCDMGAKHYQNHIMDYGFYITTDYIQVKINTSVIIMNPKTPSQSAKDGVFR